jgi:hypothetical protein
VICPKCGNQNPDLNRYCGMCGSTLDRRSAPDTELLPEDSEHPTSPVMAAAPPEPPDELRRRVREGFERGVERKPDLRPPARPDLEDLAQAAAQTETQAPRRASFSNDSTSMFHLNDGPAAVEERSAPSGVTGPSFLGLNEPGGSNADYLLEDEHRGGAKKWVVLFLVLVLGGLVYAQYRANQRGSTLFAGLPAITAPRPPEPAPPLPAGTQQNAGQPELTASAPNEKLKQEQAAVKPAESGNPPANNSAKPASDQPDQKTATANTAATENKPADKKPAPQEAASATKPDSDNSEEEAPAPAPKSRAAKPARSATEKPAGSNLLEQGQRYLYGQGVRKSCDQALSLIHQAANQGNAKARAQLGGLYATGNCVPFDRATAYRWFTLALQSDPGNRLISQNRRMLWNEMSEQERSRVQAGLE